MDDGRRITTGPLNPPRRGRPRKVESGHSLGTGARDALDRTPPNGRAPASLAVVPLSPRLLDLHAAALYLGVSEWTVRDLDAGGMLARVRLPLPNGGEVRKLLFALEDLNRLVDNSKEGALG